MKLYINKLKGEVKSTDMPVTDQHGNMLPIEEERRRYWEEIFDRVLIRNDPTTEALITQDPESVNHRGCRNLEE